MPVYNPKREKLYWRDPAEFSKRSDTSDLLRDLLHYGTADPEDHSREAWNEAYQLGLIQRGFYGAWELTDLGHADILYSQYDRPTWPSDASLRRKLGLRENPHGTPPPVSNAMEDRYRTFHGIDPDVIEERRVWTPGRLVELGARAVDVGYVAHKKQSSKGPHRYVHDFGGGVKVYRRAKKGERPDLEYAEGAFPTDMIVCGNILGFTYEDEDGTLKEVSIKRKKLVGGPDSKGFADLLAIVQPTGVQYVFRGGSLSVADWLYN